mmetsp:Transcript_8330/g.13221  ORF Transcript_8330/g.13221 Transcript_8330/m.13221 type:complete len:156 (-) Transcript_8330:2278-2745(-)
MGRRALPAAEKANRRESLESNRKKFYLKHTKDPTKLANVPGQSHSDKVEFLLSFYQKTIEKQIHNHSEVTTENNLDQAECVTQAPTETVFSVPLAGSGTETTENALEPQEKEWDSIKNFTKTRLRVSEYTDEELRTLTSCPSQDQFVELKESIEC